MKDYEKSFLKGKITTVPNSRFMSLPPVRPQHLHKVLLTYFFTCRQEQKFVIVFAINTLFYEHHLPKPLTASMMTEYGVLPVNTKPSFLAPLTKAASSVNNKPATHRFTPCHGRILLNIIFIPRPIRID